MEPVRAGSSRALSFSLLLCDYIQNANFVGIWLNHTPQAITSGEHGDAAPSNQTQNLAAAAAAGLARDLHACPHHRRRYEEDVALAKQAGCNAFRLSIEWSRIEPQRGHIDMDAVARCGAGIEQGEGEVGG